MTTTVFSVIWPLKRLVSIYFSSVLFSRDCWATIPINWNLNLSPLDMILQARADFDNIIFREIVITACWVI